MKFFVCYISECVAIIVGLLNQEGAALFLEVYPVGFFFLGSSMGCFVLQLCLHFLILPGNGHFCMYLCFQLVI